VVLQVCHPGGSELATLLTAAAAALLDAGIAMRAMFASAAVAHTDADELLVDPDSREELVRASL
jgi:ribonuclease PH